MLGECCTTLRAKIKSYGSLDWALFTLTVVVVAAVVTFVAVWYDDDSDLWLAIEYSNPVQIIDIDNVVPEQAGLGARPSFELDPQIEIPARLIRNIDCMNYECPDNLLPWELNVRWQQVIDGKATTTQIPALEGFQSSSLEGNDYVVGENSTFSVQLAPFGYSEEVHAYVESEGLATSTWRIEGEVTPLIDNAPPVAWATEIFTLTHPLGTFNHDEGE